MPFSRKARDFASLARDRKTTYEFSGRKVADQDLAEILEAGRWAPSSLNFQPWTFVVIRNEKTIDGLMDLVPYGRFHSNPSLIIGLMLKAGAWGGRHRGVKDNRISPIEAHLSLGGAALQMCLRAESLGVDNCLLTPVESEIRGMLGMRKGDSVPIMVGLGYARRGAVPEPRARKPVKDIVRYERADCRRKAGCARPQSRTSQ